MRAYVCAVTAASDAANAIGGAFLQMRLVLSGGTNAVTGEEDEEEVMMELSLEQFYAMLRALESANAALEQLES